MAWFKTYAGPNDSLTLPTFWPYAHLFEELAQHKTMHFGSENLSKNENLLFKIYENNSHVFFRRFSKIQKQYLRLASTFNQNLYLEKESCNAILLDKALFDLCAPSPIAYINGWPWRNWELFWQHEDFIKSQFKPASSIVKAATDWLAPIRAKHGYVVAVLIRRTDYDAFQGGKYFFEIEQYVNWMKQFEAENTHHNMAFYIGSDEKLKEEAFGSLRSKVYFGPATATDRQKGDAHYMVNQYLHGLADVILSPPSTFTAWAGFMHNTPLMPLCVKDQNLAKTTLMLNPLKEAIAHPDFKASVQ